MRRPCLLLALCVVLGSATLANAQGLPVYDNANFLQNIVTAAQTTITAIEAVFQSKEWVLDLTALDGIQTADGIAEDMALLGQLVEQAEGLSYDLSSLQAQIDSLFSLDAAPGTTSALRERLAAIRQLKYRCYSYAMRVQTLLRTALRTVDHLQGLLDTLGGIVGSVTGNQTLGQFQAVGSKHLANLDVQIASFHRAQAVDKLEDVLILESLRHINNHVYERND